MNKSRKSNNANETDFKPLILYVVINIVIIFIAAFAIISLYGEEGLKTFENMSVILSAAITIIIGLLFIIIYHKKILDDIKRLNKKDVIFIVVMSIVLIILNNVLTALIKSSNVEMSNQDAITATLSNSKLLIIITTVLFAPLIEEMVFRYSASTIIKNDTAFIIISSIIFGALHATNAAIILYILMGIIFSISYVKTNKNIVASTLVHMINNFAAIIGMLLSLK